MKAEIACDWLMKLVLRSTLERFENLRFQEFILKFFEGTFQEFYWKVPKTDDRNRANV